jgi:hypothetical protein
MPFAARVMLGRRCSPVRPGEDVLELANGHPFANRQSRNGHTGLPGRKGVAKALLTWQPSGIALLL